jgi:hypothetical protein
MSTPFAWELNRRSAAPNSGQRGQRWSARHERERGFVLLTRNRSGGNQRLVSQDCRCAPPRRVGSGWCARGTQGFHGLKRQARWRDLVTSMISGKIAAGIAGTTGTSGLGVMGFAVFRIASAHPVPAGMWAASVALVALTAVASCFGLVLDYQLKKLDIHARGSEARTAAELQRIRLETYRTVVEKAAGEPESAPSYRELIIADALHLSVEQNGVRLADRTHVHLYSPQVGEAGPVSSGSCDAGLG